MYKREESCIDNDKVYSVVNGNRWIGEDNDDDESILTEFQRKTLALMLCELARHFFKMYFHKQQLHRRSFEFTFKMKKKLVHLLETHLFKICIKLKFIARLNCCRKSLQIYEALIFYIHTMHLLSIFLRIKMNTKMNIFSLLFFNMIHFISNFTKHETFSYFNFNHVTHQHMHHVDITTLMLWKWKWKFVLKQIHQSEKRRMMQIKKPIDNIKSFEISNEIDEIHVFHFLDFWLIFRMLRVFIHTDIQINMSW